MPIVKATLKGNEIHGFKRGFSIKAEKYDRIRQEYWVKPDQLSFIESNRDKIERNTRRCGMILVGDYYLSENPL